MREEKLRQTAKKRHRFLSRKWSEFRGEVFHGLIAVALLFMAVSLTPRSGEAQNTEYSRLLQQAEGAYRQGSWGVANQLYKRLSPLAPSREEALRIRFRITDSLWRIRGSDDPETLVRARDDLRALLSELGNGGQTHAEVNESLGDLYWGVKRVSNWKVARSYYESAINFWLLSAESTPKRERTFAILTKIVAPPWRAPSSLYGEGENYLSAALLLRVAPLAATAEQSTLIHFVLAQTLNREGLAAEEVRKEFTQSIEAGKGTRWFDEALFAFAQWEERQESGAAVPAAESRALPLYRLLTASYSKDSSPFFERAEQLSRIISSPELKIFVKRVLPGRPWSYQIQARNLRSVTVSLFRFDPDESLDPASPMVGRGTWGVGEKRWFDLLPPSKRVAVKQWSVALPSEETITDGSVLPRGAYILQVSGGGMTVREPFFVTDLYLGYTRLTDRVRLFASSLSTGKPLSGVKFKIWEKRSTAIDTPVLRYTGESGGDGIAEVPLVKPAPDTQFLDQSIESSELFELLAVARSLNGDLGAILDPQVFAARDSGAPWEVHLRTERDRYCPGDSVKFSLFAEKRDSFRRSHDLALTELVHPFQNIVARRSSKIDEFGRAVGEFPISAKWRPGDYRIDIFYTTTFGGIKKKIGDYSLRIEEQCLAPPP